MFAAFRRDEEQASLRCSNLGSDSAYYLVGNNGGMFQADGEAFCDGFEVIVPRAS